MRIWSLALAGFLALSPAVAGATLFVSVGAYQEGEDEGQGDFSAGQSGTVASGTLHGWATEQNAAVGSGPYSCNAFCQATSTHNGLARGQVDSTGRMRIGAEIGLYSPQATSSGPGEDMDVSGSSGAGASVGLTDVLKTSGVGLTYLPMNLRIEVDLRTDLSSDGVQSEARYRFRLSSAFEGQGTGSGEGQGPGSTTIFSFTASMEEDDVTDGTYWSWGVGGNHFVTDEDEDTFQEGDGPIPSVYEITVLIPFYDGVALIAAISEGEVGCQFNDCGSAEVDSLHSVYLHLEGEYVSENGYTYAAYVPGGPDVPNPTVGTVPEPGTLALLAAMLGLLPLARKRL